MLTIKIKGANSASKIAEIKPILGKSHEFSCYWVDGWLCSDWWHRDEAHLAVTHLNLISGIQAEVVEMQR